MDRRSFLKTAALAAAAGAAPWARGEAAAAPPFAPHPANGWRTFELVSRVEVVKPAGPTQVWLPLPAIHDEQWIRPTDNRWQGNADAMQVLADPVYGAAMLHARWSAAEAPVLEAVSRVATRDRAIDFRRPARPAPLSRAERALYTRATELLPTDGIVRATAQDIIRGAKSDKDKARAIYQWIVANTERDPETRGCGLGDIRTMLETRNLGGKCADLNALYVGLARSVGLPARDVYGLRVADSRFGYRSLGKSGNVSKAQHCRAEVWLADFGWVPVDPADVRKVMLEEPPGQLGLEDAKVRAVHERLFGAWEMNWLGYNFAHDVALPGSKGPPIPFLMYPQGETAEGRLDSLDPESFRYTLTAREIT